MCRFTERSMAIIETATKRKKRKTVTQTTSFFSIIHKLPFEKKNMASTRAVREVRGIWS